MKINSTTAFASSALVILAAATGALADVPKSGTAPYTTHFVFYPKSTVDIPGVGKATALEAVGPTENTDGGTMYDKMKAKCAAVKIESGGKTWFDGACALTDATGGGKVYCWGTGSGSVLGDGTSEARAFAKPVASALVPTKTDLQGVRLLAVGESSACVAVGDRDVRCWGQGPLGERGEASSTSSIPRVVDDLP